MAVTSTQLRLGPKDKINPDGTITSNLGSALGTYTFKYDPNDLSSARRIRDAELARRRGIVNEQGLNKGDARAAFIKAEEGKSAAQSQVQEAFKGGEITLANLPKLETVEEPPVSRTAASMPSSSTRTYTLRDGSVKTVTGTGNTATRSTVSSPARTAAVAQARTYNVKMPDGSTKTVQVQGGGNQAVRSNIATAPGTTSGNPPGAQGTAPGTAPQIAGTTGSSGQSVTGNIATGQSSSPSSNIFENPAFKEALTRIESSDQERTKMVEDIKRSMESNAANKKSVWDRLYGEDSKLSTFFSPALKNVEEQILDVEGLLESLKSDIDTSTQGVGITSAQRNRVLAKEQTGLTTQMSQLGRAYERLRAGYDDTLALADREFNALTSAAQDEVDAAIFELENSGMSPQESALIGSALNAQLQLDIQERIAEREAAQMQAAAQADQQAAEAESQAETTKAVDKILSDALTFVQKAGAVPSAQFSKVVQDAHRMAEQGASMGEIQAGVMAAIGSNPTVKKYLDAQLQQEIKSATAKASGGGSGASGTKLTAEQQLAAVQLGIDPNKRLNQLTAAEAEAINKKKKTSSGDALLEALLGD